MLRENSDGLYGVTHDLRDHNRPGGTLVVNSPPEHVLDRLRTSTVRNVRCVDSNRRIEQYASEMVGTACARRTVLHLSLVRPCVVNELVEIVDWQIVAHHQHD